MDMRQAELDATAGRMVGRQLRSSLIAAGYIDWMDDVVYARAREIFKRKLGEYRCEGSGASAYKKSSMSLAALPSSFGVSLAPKDSGSPSLTVAVPTIPTQQREVA